MNVEAYDNAVPRSVTDKQNNRLRAGFLICGYDAQVPMIKDEPKIDNAQANDAIDIDANASINNMM